MSICLLIHLNPDQTFIACQLCAGDSEVGRKDMASPPRSSCSNEKSEKRVVTVMAGTGCFRGSEEAHGPGTGASKGVLQAAMPSTSFSKQKDGKALSTTTSSHPRNEAIGSSTYQRHHLDTPSPSIITTSLSKPFPAQLPNSLRIQCPVSSCSYQKIPSCLPPSPQLPTFHSKEA